MRPIRLKKRKQFVHIAHKGRKLVASGLILQFIKSELSNQNRVGFTVTKKVGNAVQRNRIRRRLKEVIRLGLPAFKKTGYDFVIIGRKATLDRSFSSLQNDFARLLDDVE